VRIFVASGIFHPDSGGPATYLYRLLPDLLARGHEVHALAYGNAPTADYPYPLTRIPFTFTPIRLVRYANAYRAGAAWADLVYINSLGLPRYGAASRPRVMKIVGDYAWERAVNKGMIAPTEDIDAFQRRRYTPIVEFLKAARAREARHVDRVIVPSAYLRDMVVGWGVEPSSVQVIYNALDAGVYAPRLSRSDARDPLGWQRDSHYMLTAGRLTAWKGINYVIDAVGQVPDLRLVIAGDGPQLETLRARAAPLNDRAIFLGKVPHERMALLLRAADYLILYSGYEGLSHTILEALYAGTPVIASRRGGNPELIRDGENGLLVDHPNPEALVGALRRAFEGDLQARLAANTAHGLERFAWSDLLDQTIRTLTEVAGR